MNNSKRLVTILVGLASIGGGCTVSSAQQQKSSEANPPKAAKPRQGRVLTPGNQGYFPGDDNKYLAASLQDLTKFYTAAVAKDRKQLQNLIAAKRVFPMRSGERVKAIDKRVRDGAEGKGTLIQLRIQTGPNAGRTGWMGDIHPR